MYTTQEREEDCSIGYCRTLWSAGSHEKKLEPTGADDDTVYFRGGKKCNPPGAQLGKISSSSFSFLFKRDEEKKKKVLVLEWTISIVFSKILTHREKMFFSNSG